MSVLLQCTSTHTALHCNCNPLATTVPITTSTHHFTHQGMLQSAFSCFSPRWFSFLLGQNLAKVAWHRWLGRFCCYQESCFSLKARVWSGFFTVHSLAMLSNQNVIFCSKRWISIPFHPSLTNGQLTPHDTGLANFLYSCCDVPFRQPRITINSIVLLCYSNSTNCVMYVHGALHRRVMVRKQFPEGNGDRLTVIRANLPRMRGTFRASIV